MTRETRVLLLLRRRKGAHSAARLAYLGLAVAAFLILIVSTALVLISLEYAYLSSSYPPISQIGTFLSSGNREFLPTRFYDSSGVPLFAAVHPSAVERYWLGEGSGTGEGIPDLIRNVVVAAQPEAFKSPGLIDHLFDPARMPSIPQQLLRSTLLHSNALEGGHWMTPYLEVQLAAELMKMYSEDQILEWYLNTAYFGNFAYGFDAAGLVYFDKHAEDLTLAEAAFLAVIPLHSGSSLLETPVEAFMLQEQVLQRMCDQDFISRQEAVEAGEERLEFRQGITADVPVELTILQDELSRILPGAEAFTGLRVITSLDHELHTQALEALQSAQPWISWPAFPSSVREDVIDISGERRQQAIPLTWIIQDPEDGSVLSFGGGITESHTLGSAVDPLIYLAAYARGQSPGSMVLDIPDGVPVSSSGEENFEGPVRMREAFKNSLAGARREVVEFIGLGQILSIGRQLGLEGMIAGPGSDGPLQLLHTQASLLELGSLYSVLANEGRQAGQLYAGGITAEEQQTGINPVLIQRVEHSGGLLYERELVEMSVVSRQLAYLLVDSLLHTPFDRSNLCTGAAADGDWAMHCGSPSGGEAAWVMGSSPGRTIGVWLGSGNADTEAWNSDLSILIWNDLATAVEATGSIGEWIEPPGIGHVEVCDPSGSLPTADCPTVVEELFAAGSEPRAYDTLYQTAAVNRETGRLATVYTPAELIEYRTYLRLPEKALAWAAANEITQIPVEYDTIRVPDREYGFVEPVPLQMLRGEIEILWETSSADVELVRMEVGEGLFPEKWLLLEELDTPPHSPIASVWDTGSLSGLYIIQAVVVDSGGKVSISSVPVILDNTAPDVGVQIRFQGDGGFPAGEVFVAEVLAEDNYGVNRVELILDDRVIEVWDGEPYQVRLTLPAGRYSLQARALDAAGNEAESETVLVDIPDL